MLTEEEQIAIRRRRLQLEAEAAASAAPPPPAEEGTSVLRDVVAAGLTGPSKMLAGGIDLATMLGAPHAIPQTVARAVLSGKLPESTFDLTGKVNALRDQIAGRSLEKSTPAAVAEGVTGGLIFPGGPVINALSGGAGALVSHKLQEGGSGPLVAAGGGMAAGLVPGLTGLAFKTPQIHLVHRLREALKGVLSGDTEAGKRMQTLAAAEGVPVFPSQAVPGSAPGLRQLETELLRSKAAGAQGVQQKAFEQPLLADALAKRTLREALPLEANATPERAAADLQGAAVKRLAAGEEAHRRALDPAWAEAGKTKERVGLADLEDSHAVVMKALRDTTLPEQAKGPLMQMRRFLESRLPPPELEQAVARLEKLLAIAKKPEDVVKIDRALVEAQAKLDKARAAATASPQELRAKYQDIETKLNEVDAAGKRTYSDRAAGQVRKVLDEAYRGKLEKAEPLYEVARKLTSDRRQSFAPRAFDPVEALAGASSGDPRRALTAALAQPRGLVEVAKGVPVRQASGQRAVEGANPDAVRQALGQALEQARQQSFQPTAAGELLQSAPAAFTRSVAGTPTQRQGLEMALRSAGVDPEPLLRRLDVLRAAGQPTEVHGSRVPATDISTADLIRGTIGGQLQQQQARISILRSTVNRLSDRQVATILEHPNSIQEMQRIVGAGTMAPRDLLMAILASQSQAMDSNSTQR